MCIFLVLVVPERIEAFFEIYAHRWRYIVVYAGLIVHVFVLVVEGEVCDLLWALDARCAILEAFERLYRESMRLQLDRLF